MLFALCEIKTTFCHLFLFILLYAPHPAFIKLYIKLYRSAFYSQPFSFNVLQSLHSVLLTCAFCCSPACCQSPVLSNWVLLDISHMDIAVFNIRCTHLKTADSVQDFQSSKVIQIYCIAQYKKIQVTQQNTATVINSWGTIPVYSPLSNSMICSPSWPCTSPVARNECVG